MSIHPIAQSFDTSADDYERGRPTYPAEALAWLAEVLRLRPGATVVDLAAGTGKLTRLLLPTGAAVVAVEPLAGMREVLARVVPGVRVLGGTAESIPLPTGRADALTVGQAFHWFRGPEALAEIHRVLRRGGRLGLLWNRRDLSQPLQAELDEAVDRHRGEAPAHTSGRWRQAFEETVLFGPLQTAEFALRQELDADGVVARVLSISFNAGLVGAARAHLIEELRTTVARHGESVVLDYVTDAYWCESV